MNLKNNSGEADGAGALEGRIHEIKSLLDFVKGQDGATIEIKVDNRGSGPATEYMDVTITSQDGEGGARTECYNVKRFLKKTTQTPFPFLNLGGVRQNEFDFLVGYGNVGCSVPVPSKKTGDLIITQKIKGRSLEPILLENASSERARIKLIKRATECIDNLHEGGRRIQGDILSNNAEMAKKIVRCADLLKPSEDYFTSFAASEEDLVGVRAEGKDGKELVANVKEKCKDNYSTFKSFFEILDNHFSRQETQLIHGDMTTYHVWIDDSSKIWVLDLDKPKLSNVVFDLAPVYFSQDTNLPVSVIEEIFKEHLSRIYTPKDRMREEIKSLYLGGCFSNIGRGSKNRVLRVAYPDQYLMFVRKHPSFSESVPFYKSCTRELIEYVLRNREEFAIDMEDYGTMKKFLDLSDKFIPDTNGGPIAILFDGERRREKVRDSRARGTSRVKGTKARTT